MNRRRAIKLKCMECSADEIKEVKNCPCTDCSLYPFRSGKGNQNPKERDRAIRKYCIWCVVDQPGELNYCSCDCPLYDFRGFIRPEKRLKSSKKVSPADISGHDLIEIIPEHHPSDEIHLKCSLWTKNDENGSSNLEKSLKMTTWSRSKLTSPWPD